MILPPPSRHGFQQGSHAHAGETPASEASTLFMRIAGLLLALGIPWGSIFSKYLIFPFLPTGLFFILLSFILAPASVKEVRLRDFFQMPLVQVGFFLAGWICLSLLWTPYPLISLEYVFKSLGTFGLAVVALFVLPPRTKRSYLYLFPAGLLGGLVLTGLAFILKPGNFLLTSAEFEISLREKSLLIFMMLLWPCLAILSLRERWNLASGLAFIVGGFLLFVWVPFVLLALACGCLVFGFAVTAPQKTSLILGTVTSILVLIAPALLFGIGNVAHYFFPHHALGFDIWADIIRHEGIRLLTGHGINTLMPALQREVLLPETPRSFLFEIWYELGLVGAVAVALFFWHMFYHLAHLKNNWLTPFILAALGSGFVISFSGRATFQLWWMSVVVFIIVVFFLVSHGKYHTKRPRLSPSSASETDLSSVSYGGEEALSVK